MADVQHLKDKGIPLKIDGATRFVRGATKYTTCADVIKMVLKKTGIGKEYRHLFAIYEISLTGEKLLPCKDRILKIIEAWGGVPNRLVLRKTDPIAAMPNVESDGQQCETKQKKYTKQPTDKQTEDTYMQTLISLSNFVEKQKNKLQGKHDVVSESTSDSDSSMDEFLSKLDKTKMAGFVHFFAAMAGNKSKSTANKRTSTKRNSRRQTSETDESSEHSPTAFQRRRWRTKHTVKDGIKYHQSRHTRKSEKGDIHPNKTNRVERVNFGFIDVEPSSRDQVYTYTKANEKHECPKPRLSNKVQHISRINSASRRLLPGKRSSYKMTKDNSCGTGLLHNLSTSTSEDEYYMVGTFKPVIEPTTKSHGYYGDRDNSTSSASSSDLDNAFVLTSHTTHSCHGEHKRSCAGVPDIRRCARTLTYDDNVSEVRDSIELDGCKTVEHKLVDYTLTDSELSDSDSDLGSEGSKYSFTSSSTSSNCHTNDQKSTRSNPFGNIEEKKCANGCDVISGNDVNSDYHLDKMADKLDVSDYIRSLFSKSCLISEDEAMDSFMKSMICEEDSSSDEGLCSMGSDSEKDVRL